MIPSRLFYCRELSSSIAGDRALSSVILIKVEERQHNLVRGTSSTMLDNPDARQCSDGCPR